MALAISALARRPASTAASSIALRLRVGVLEQQVSERAEGTVYEVVLGGLSAAEGHGDGGKRQVEVVLSRVGLDGEARFVTLSAGNRRRVLLARALVGEPDLVLLDEPTNHLDVDAIRWLEEFFVRHDGTVVFVTHDRAFLGRLATRIVEPIGCLRLGDYATYLRREQALADEEDWPRPSTSGSPRRRPGRQ